MLNCLLLSVGSAASSTGQDTEVLERTRSKTVGVVDMGGGSLQIAFEVDNPVCYVMQFTIIQLNMIFL